MKLSKPIIAVIIVLVLLLIWAYNNIYVRTSFRVLNNLEGGAIPLTDFKAKAEGVLVSPLNPFLLKSIKKLYDSFKPIYVYNIDSYVTFTRLNTSAT